ncbi:tetratricopeptide repeat protein [Antarcticibacterium arcticum]|uniref:Tetratricopeptide repeat protein n=1 Tax=Antarcticibacterium arcticum TaxID=2585771 RepID=A0A5B8YKV5_9FLAO|nr:tetratricopeptide repeat protein [Antarcticibacterium arcticum]QED38532.1 tetratricopeptide repeat protein [Antarcticibacterium arcticum]
MKKLFFLFVFFVTALQAQNQDLFEVGNNAYNEGDYETAVSNYESIINNGETSAAVYFNLANSYYKLNRVAPSIYYYEKALQLEPNDADINNNLALARNLVVDEIVENENSGLSRIWNNLVSGLGYNQWGWAAVIFSFLFAISFAVYYYSSRSVSKRIFFSLSLVTVFLALLFLIFAFQQKGKFSDNNYAIIFASESPVREEPTLRSAESFFLHEGTKIEVLETYQNWIKFKLANGIQGWMLKDDVRMF